MKQMKISRSGIIRIAFTAAAEIYLLINHKLFGRGVNGGKMTWIFVFLGLQLLLLGTLARALYRDYKTGGAKPEKKRIGILHFLLSLLVYPVIWHFGTELIVSEELGKISLEHNLMSIGICAAVFLILFFLFHSLRVASLAGCIFYGVFGAVEYYTIAFRSIPVMYSDLLDVGAAATVMGGYSLYPTKGLITVAVVFYAAHSNFLMRGDRVPGTKRWTNLAGRAAAVAAAILLVIGIGRSAAFTESVGNLSRPLKNFHQIGSQLCFIQSIKNAQIRMPEGYSPAAVEKMAAEYKEKAVAYNAALKNEDRPNVIAIMDESFSDIDVTGAHHLREQNMPFVSSMKDNTVKGSVMVSTFGGGTGRSEFEFNTDASMHLFDSSTSPYAMFGQKLKYALASQLRDQGYHTVAIHPHVRTNYNRPRTYEAMGFDEYLSREDFEGAERIRKYVSDEAAFEKITEITDKTEEPAFVFMVTMQNHGGYDDTSFESTVDLEVDDAGAKQFASLIKLSDEAVEKMIEHYGKSDEKTLIVFFGDHFPSLGGAFYKPYNGFTKDDADIEKSQLYYQTPYFIWANYDIPEEERLTSLNYLGLDMLKLAGSRLTPYQMYLSELQEQVPAFSLRLYNGTDGKYYSFGTDEKVDALLNEYDCVEYNMVVDTRHRCEEMFRLPESQ